jgi:hypothetical protein
MAKAVLKNVADQKLSSIKNKDFYYSKISHSPYSAKIANVVPFRVRFTNIGIESYSAGNPAPIGIAIIGYSNYIL